jgi:anti-sigma regulatory factor (Ser/Thr protein kinase)
MLTGELQHGDHACLFYDSAGEQLEAVVPALEQALAGGEQCIYVADEPTVAQVTGALTAAAVDVDQARDRRALRLLTERDAYLSAGEFNPRALAAFWERTITEALGDGFTGVVVTGEMTWAFGHESRSPRMMVWEGLVNTLLPGRPAAALCQYNTPRVTPRLVPEMLRVHPVLRIPLTPETDVVAARRRGWALAAELGFAPRDLTLLWTVLSELARNAVEHGWRGQLVLRRIADDKGLGIRANVRVEPAEGTASALLPSRPEVERLMDEFEVLSEPGRGATMTMTKWVR